MIGFLSFYASMETEGHSLHAFFESNVGNFDLSKMHLVNNDDSLRIFDKNDQKPIWSGIVNFKSHVLIDANNLYGACLYQEGEDPDWNKYFIENNPAELIKKEQKI